MKMLKKIPLKIKAYIFIALSIVGIAIVVSAGIKNHEIKVRNTEARNKLEKEKKQQEEQKALEEKKRAAEEEKKNQEKIKQIEDKYQKGYVAFMNGQYSTAISIEDEVLAEDNMNYKAYNLKGIAVCYSKGNRFDEGMSFIDKALELKPDYDYARFNKALANELFGHYEEALKLYDKALELKDSTWNVWSYYGKASIYGRDGDVKNTIENLKIAIGMDPSIKDLAAEEADFAKVKDAKEFQDLLKK
jgi:tetratricopeptide (TPR) repeat protein